VVPLVLTVDPTQSLGITYPISDSVADTDAVKALYWQQDLPGDRASLRFGHVDPNGIVLKCSYACDDTTLFISGPLSGNVTGTNAGQGWGVQAFFKTGTAISLEAGVGDANGDGKLNTDRSVKSDELAYSAAVIAENLFPTLGDGAIRLGYYQVDPTKRGTSDAQARTSGVVLAAEQDVGDYGLFARYAESFGRHSGSRSTGAAGIVWKKPFGYDEDRLGFGVSYVEPSAEDTDAEYLSEVFYRMQITPLAELSAGAIVLNRPNNADDTGAEAVFNLRLRYAF
jgi:carbohydrate-selective porin OprB